MKDKEPRVEELNPLRKKEGSVFYFFSADRDCVLSGKTRIPSCIRGA